jgi:REJ domain
MMWQWTCSITSFSGYGKHCGVLADSVTTTSILTVSANKMAQGEEYSFLLAVSSRDGRSSSQAVAVTAVAQGSPQTHITSAVSKFNIGSRVSIAGALSSTSTVSSTWSAFTLEGVPVPFKAITPIVQTITNTGSAFQPFPLSFQSGDFIGGRAYIFRLSAQRIEAAPTAFSITAVSTTSPSFSEITMTANSPPTGGFMSSTPTQGDALLTKFLLSTAGWTADVANFPLTYSFSYRLSAASQYLSLAASSLRAYTVSTLPAGLKMLDNLITIQVKATDTFLASGKATGTVKVLVNPAVNLTLVLANGIASALASGNYDLAFQIVNNVSEKIADKRHTLLSIYCQRETSSSTRLGNYDLLSLIMSSFTIPHHPQPVRHMSSLIPKLQLLTGGDHNEHCRLQQCA